MAARYRLPIRRAEPWERRSTNPRQALTGAIHIYGGATSPAGRGAASGDEAVTEEVSYDCERVKRYFNAADAQLR